LRRNRRDEKGESDLEWARPEKASQEEATDSLDVFLLP